LIGEGGEGSTEKSGGFLTEGVTGTVVGVPVQPVADWVTVRDAVKPRVGRLTVLGFDEQVTS
jgi:hypothetical protein